MRAALAIVVLFGVAGCPGLRRHSGVRNAPGNVDLDLPPVRETGNPTTYEAPADPGMHRMGIAPGFFIGPATGRLGSADGDDSALELGMQLHLSFEDSSKSAGRDAFGYPTNAWGVSVGWAFVQTYEFGPDVIGPVYVEATRHFWFASAGAGVAVYPTPGEVVDGVGGVDVGAQVTLAAWPYVLRMRYMQDTGFELAGVIQIELPTSLTWSR